MTNARTITGWLLTIGDGPTGPRVEIELWEGKKITINSDQETLMAQPPCLYKEIVATYYLATGTEEPTLINLKPKEQEE